MSQDPEPLVHWKHEPKSKKPWSSKNMSQDPKILGLWKHEPGSRTLVLWKHEPKPKKPLVLWKHEPRSKNPRSLKTWARIRCPPSKHILYSLKKKKKKNLHAWTTFGPNPPTKRYVGNLPQDSVRILIHYMIICIFIYMHHTFTTVKYWLQS